MEWERKFETASLENHKQFLRDAPLTVGNHPMEAAAWENGYVPEAEGLPSDQLESRIQGLLPPLAYVVSRPRQPTTAGEELLRRFDAVTGSLALVGTPRCTNIKSMERHDDSSLLLMWFDQGPNPPMHVCVSP